jgi:hypothetical protein
LSALLSPPRKVTPVEHHPAIPCADLPAFWADLLAHVGMSPLCLQRVILTACRSGEAPGCAVAGG